MIDLDIVIVNWNARFQLKECLQSISCACSAPGIRLQLCVVVDNASVDGSADGLEGLIHPLTKITNRKNKGFAFACNQGAELGTAEYLLFLNPDIRLFQDSLAKALFFLQDVQNSNIGILGIQLVDHDGVIQQNVSRFPTPTSLFYQMLGLDRVLPRRFLSHFRTDWDHGESQEVDQVQGAFYLIRRELFEYLDGFDERFFMYFEDLDFSYRANQAGWKNYYYADARAFHYGGGASEQVKARRLFYVLNSRILYVEKHFGAFSALRILMASIFLEFWVRLGWSLFNLSGKDFLETISAYTMYLKMIPQLLKNIRSEKECASLP